jgi:hypothetical protein
MYNVSQNFLDYINNPNNIGRTVQNKVVIDGIEYFSDSLKTNPKIKQEATSFIGGFPSKTCEFEILNLDGSITLNNKEIEVYKGELINGTTTWILMGKFKALDPNITNNESTKAIKFNGNDRAILFDAPYTSNLDWETSHTGLEIVQEICDTISSGVIYPDENLYADETVYPQMAITLDTLNFAFADYVFTSKPNFPENTTYREVIARIAEIGGEIAFISREGNLKIVGQTATGQTVGKEKRISLTKEPLYGAINTVALGKANIDDDIIYPATIETERITWRIEDNPFVDLIREEIIEEVASHIIGMSITPFTINGFIDDFIYDLNDVISVTDNDGNTFNGVLLKYETNNRIRSNVGAEAQTEKLVNHDIAGSTKNTIARVSLQVNHNTQQIELLATKTEELENEITESTTTILQDAEAIIMQALTEYVTTGELETLQQTISTQFEQTSETFQFQFSNIISQINNIDGSLQEEINERIKYIRFEDGNIIIGVAGNDLILKQSNDKIAFIQGENEVAYFSNNKLYVTDGEFLNSLKIGRFQWLPRQNGNLGLVFVGGDS